MSGPSEADALLIASTRERADALSLPHDAIDDVWERFVRDEPQQVREAPDPGQPSPPNLYAVHRLACIRRSTMSNAQRMIHLSPSDLRIFHQYG